MPSSGLRGWLPLPSNTTDHGEREAGWCSHPDRRGSCGSRRATDLEAGTGGGGSVRAAPLGRDDLKPPFPRDQHPLPAGHPETGGLLTRGTSLDGTPWPDLQ